MHKQVEQLGLDRDVQRRRRLVCDQHLRAGREGDRDRDALAQTTGELVGKLTEPAFGFGHADLLEEVVRPSKRLTPGSRAVRLDRFRDLPTDRENGVEGAHRVLEDHPDALAPDRAHLLLR